MEDDLITVDDSDDSLVADCGSPRFSNFSDRGNVRPVLLSLEGRAETIELECAIS